MDYIKSLFGFATVSSICQSFVANLKTIETRQGKLVDKHTGIADRAMLTAKSARVEQELATTAIQNVHTLFGINQ